MVLVDSNGIWTQCLWKTPCSKLLHGSIWAQWHFVSRPSKHPCSKGSNLVTFQSRSKTNWRDRGHHTMTKLHIYLAQTALNVYNYARCKNDARWTMFNVKGTQYVAFLHSSCARSSQRWSWQNDLLQYFCCSSALEKMRGIASAAMYNPSAVFKHQKGGKETLSVLQPLCSVHSYGHYKAMHFIYEWTGRGQIEN